MAIVTIGILAHVDAGKTTLTERVLFESGVIAALGSVDKGTTQTDALELERARGISIKSAVVSFQLNTLKVNLIDTPGHADFVAEVARCLDVLDGVILVVSAVEGVQAQTRRLAQAVRNAGLPLLVFVNKIDRLGARGEALLDDLRRKLKLRPVAMNAPFATGQRSAGVAPCDPCDAEWRGGVIDALAESSERVIEAFDRSRGDLGWSFVEPELRAQTARGEVAPVYFGSAITGAGVGHLLDGIECLLPRADEKHELPLSGRVFKIARRPTGEKIVYARVFTGALTVRQRLPVHRGDEAFEERVTGIDQFVSGATIAAESAAAGEIVCLHGLRGVRIGDQLGEPGTDRGWAREFAAPSLESVVRPVNPAEVTTLRTALETLAEQDPLISLRQRNQEGEISVRLYGEVQKEVIADTLIREFGVEASFGPSQTVCIERPAGAGASHDIIGTSGNPFFATVGFRIEPGEPGGGIDYRRELGSLPLAFYRAIEETTYDALSQGLHGWEVTDCVVTLTHAGFWSPVSTAADFRKLTPLVLFAALAHAGTTVCEPVETLELEIPESAYGAVCGALIHARATIRNSVLDGAGYRIACAIPTAELRGVEMRLSALTGGDGGWSSVPAGYVLVTGEPPARTRIGPNPLNRAHYLADLARG